MWAAPRWPESFSAIASEANVYTVQAVCAVIVRLCLTGVNFKRKHEVQTGSPLDGLRFIRDNKLILSAVSLDLFAYLFGGAVALLPIYAVDILHAGPRALGWLRAAPSVGAIPMAVTMAHSPKIRRAGPVLLWSVAGFGLATIGFGLSRSIWLSCGMLALTGAFDNVSVVLRQSVLQTKTPDFVRGRADTVNRLHQLLEFTGSCRIGMDCGVVRPRPQRRRWRHCGDCCRGALRRTLAGTSALGTIAGIMTYASMETRFRPAALAR